jgi:asparagine synthase (glutamine-hydrolysing)
VPRLSPGLIGGKAARYLRWATEPLEARYRGVSSVFGERERDRVLAPEWRGTDDGDVGSEYFARTEGLHPLQRMLYFDVKVWLPDDLLVKADKMTMAASMELRVPFLDHLLMEWAWRLPPGLKLKGGTGKYLLRRAAADLLPPAIATRPKRGFAIPVQQWLRDGLAAQARRLLVEEGSHRRFFDLHQVETLLAQHRRGGSDVSEQLFALVMFALWHRTFIEARTVTAPPAAADA